MSPVCSSSSSRPRLFGSRATALEVLNDVNLAGRTFLITGGSAGIGIETARSIALHGAHVVMANRNLVESDKVKSRILSEKSDAKVDIISLDLSSLKSVQEATSEYIKQGWPLDVLILNAGVLGPAAKTTAEGYESCFGVNHIGNFYIFFGNPAKLISTSAPLEKKLQELHPKTTENDYRRYSKSKLCNVLFAFKLHHDEYASNNIAIYVLHPGFIRTSIHRDYGVWGKIFQTVTSPFAKSLQQGAATTVYCATAEDAAELSGRYWDSCWDDEKTLQKELAHDESLQDALWNFSENEIRKFEERNSVQVTGF